MIHMVPTDKIWNIDISFCFISQKYMLIENH